MVWGDMRKDGDNGVASLRGNVACSVDKGLI